METSSIICFSTQDILNAIETVAANERTSDHSLLYHRLFCCIPLPHNRFIDIFNTFCVDIRLKSTEFCYADFLQFFVSILAIKSEDKFTTREARMYRVLLEAACFQNPKVLKRIKYLEEIDIGRIFNGLLACKIKKLLVNFYILQLHTNWGKMDAFLYW